MSQVPSALNRCMASAIKPTGSMYPYRKYLGRRGLRIWLLKGPSICLDPPLHCVFRLHMHEHEKPPLPTENAFWPKKRLQVVDSTHNASSSTSMVMLIPHIPDLVRIVNIQTCIHTYIHIYLCWISLLARARDAGCCRTSLA